MQATRPTPAAWATELGLLAGGLLLLVRDRAAIHAGQTTDIAVAAVFLVVFAGAALALSVRVAPPRLAPLLLTLTVSGLIRSDAPLVAVIGFAAAALVPIAALYAAGAQPRRWMPTALAIAALITFATRIFARDPFRELRCAPACIQNPLLVTHAPDLLRHSERALATLTLAWAVMAAIHLRRRWTLSADVASTLVVLSVAAVWAARLLQQPRPAPVDSVDQWVTIALLGAVAAIAVLRAWTPLAVARVRRRIERVASALSSAGDVTAIRRHLRDVTRDSSLDVELGDESTEPPRTSAVTSVVRGGRVVATIRHAPSTRASIAAAITPATALAMETQLLLHQARQQLVALTASRTIAVQTTDDARRRLERDLHDGAQQRLLVAGMTLAHAATKEAPDSPLRGAASRVSEALTDLRRIGRGDAAVIAELGLDDAVTAIAGAADLPMTVISSRCGSPTHECWPENEGTTAYRLVNASLAAAQQSGAKELSVELRCLGTGTGRTIATHHDGDRATERSADHDRVMAGNGQIIADDGHVFEVWLP